MNEGVEQKIIKRKKTRQALSLVFWAYILFESVTRIYQYANAQEGSMIIFMIISIVLLLLGVVMVPLLIRQVLAPNVALTIDSNGFRESLTGRNEQRFSWEEVAEVKAGNGRMRDTLFVHLKEGVAFSNSNGSDFHTRLSEMNIKKFGTPLVWHAKLTSAGAEEIKDLMVAHMTQLKHEE